LNEFELFQNLINFTAGPQVSSLSHTHSFLCSRRAPSRAARAHRGWVSVVAGSLLRSHATRQTAYPPPPPILPLVLSTKPIKGHTLVFFCHCCPAGAHRASAASPPLSFNQATKGVRVSRFVVLHRSFSPDTPRASTISTFPRHLRTSPLNTVVVNSPSSVRIWPAPFFHEELKRLAQLSNSSFLAIPWLVAMHPATSSAMAATPWSIAWLELPPLPLLRCRTVVKSHGAHAASRSAPSRLPRRIPPRMPPPPVCSYRLSSTHLPRAPLFSWLSSAGRPPFADSRVAQHTTRELSMCCRRVHRLVPHGVVTTPRATYHVGWHGPAQPNSLLGQAHQSTRPLRPVTYSRPPPREG
jgi:hypothetical protein